MIIEQERFRVTDWRRRRAPGPKWRVEEAFLVELLEQEYCVMMLCEASFLIDWSVKSFGCRDGLCFSNSKPIIWVYIIFRQDRHFKFSSAVSPRSHHIVTVACNMVGAHIMALPASMGLITSPTCSPVGYCDSGYHVAR